MNRPGNIDGERRQHERLPLNRPCKMYDAQSGRYIAGATQDVSAGGALIEVPRIIWLKPGDTLHVGVAQKRRQHLLHSAEMMKAAVTRALHTADDRTLLGVQFEQLQIHVPAAADGLSHRLAA